MGEPDDASWEHYAKPEKLDIDPHKLEFRRFLCLSTRHLTAEQGGSNEIEGCVTYAEENGLFLWVPNNPVESDCMEDRVPPEILRLQILAREHDCDYILFDCDGPEVEGIPKWEW